MSFHFPPDSLHVWPRHFPRGVQVKPCIQCQVQPFSTSCQRTRVSPLNGPILQSCLGTCCGSFFFFFFFSFSRVFFSFQTLSVCQVPTVGDHCRHDACSKSYINPDDVRPKSTLFFFNHPHSLIHSLDKLCLSFLSRSNLVLLFYHLHQKSYILASVEQTQSIS